MNQLKRKLSSDDSSQSNITITCLEDLSDEYFYEIFEHLDSYEVYKIFSKLNSRFHRIIDHTWFLFRFEIDATPSIEHLDYFQYNLIHNRHRICSIDIFDMRNESVAKSCLLIDSSCIRLKEIHLSEIEGNLLLQLLHKYSQLPCLKILDIDINDRIRYDKTIEIYQLIFAQTKLKSFRFSVSIDNELLGSLPLSMALIEQYTGIQYLYLNHCVDLNELFLILSYTPRIYKLIVSFVLDKKNYNLKHKTPISLNNLKYLSIEHYEADFDDLDMFFSKVICLLEYFYLLIRHRRDNYHYPYLWKAFIGKYLWFLQDFTLIFQESNNSQSEILNETLLFKQICSDFWNYIPINFELDISLDDIKHKITPYQYEFKKMNSPMKLCLTNIDIKQSFSIIEFYAYQILFIVKIDHVQIKKISMETLIKILELIPQLDSIQISDLSINQTDYTTEINENQIRKVCLGKLNSVKQLDLIFKIFPHMKYFRLNSTTNINIPILFHYIIKAIPNNQLQYISFHNLVACEEVIANLQMMIQSEKLLLEYTIQRIFNNIYIGWK